MARLEHEPIYTCRAREIHHVPELAIWAMGNGEIESLSCRIKQRKQGYAGAKAVHFFVFLGAGTGCFSGVSLVGFFGPSPPVAMEVFMMLPFVLRLAVAGLDKCPDERSEDQCWDEPDCEVGHDASFSRDFLSHNVPLVDLRLLPLVAH